MISAAKGGNLLRVLLWKRPSLYSLQHQGKAHMRNVIAPPKGTLLTIIKTIFPSSDCFLCCLPAMQNQAPSEMMARWVRCGEAGLCCLATVPCNLVLSSLSLPGGAVIERHRRYGEQLIPHINQPLELISAIAEKWLVCPRVLNASAEAGQAISSSSYQC